MEKKGKKKENKKKRGEKKKEKRRRKMRRNRKRKRGRRELLTNFPKFSRGGFPVERIVINLMVPLLNNEIAGHIYVSIEDCRIDTET